MTTNNPFFQSARACVILTGASRGFGVALATALAEHYRDQFTPFDSSDLEQQLTFVLIARNGAQLELVAEQLSQIDTRVKVNTTACDLSQVQAIESTEQFLQENNLFHPDQSFGHFVLLHNAGSIGDANLLCKSISTKLAQDRDKYYRLNLFSVMELTAFFIRQTESIASKPSRHIINISSLAAIQPFTGLVDYCVGKASREAYFRSLVSELQDDPSNGTIRVLNYAPGPLDTDMFDLLRKDSLVSEAFQQMVPLTTDQSAQKLIKLLVNNSYPNGSHVDYYDEE